MAVAGPDLAAAGLTALEGNQEEIRRRKIGDDLPLGARNLILLLSQCRRLTRPRARTRGSSTPVWTQDFLAGDAVFTIESKDLSQSTVVSFQCTGNSNSINHKQDKSNAIVSKYSLTAIYLAIGSR
jgi:hypothetical protein